MHLAIRETPKTQNGTLSAQCARSEAFFQSTNVPWNRANSPQSTRLSIRWTIWDALAPPTSKTTRPRRDPLHSMPRTRALPPITTASTGKNLPRCAAEFAGPSGQIIPTIPKGLRHPAQGGMRQDWCVLLIRCFHDRVAEELLDRVNAFTPAIGRSFFALGRVARIAPLRRWHEPRCPCVWHGC